MQPVAILWSIPIADFEATYSLAIDKFKRILMLLIAQPVAHQGRASLNDTRMQETHGWISASST
jgi:hypothetical protein